MSVQVRTTANPTANNTTSTFTINKPSGLENGEVMYAVVIRDQNAAPTGEPSNWATLATIADGTNALWMRLYRKVVTDAAGEPGSYTWTWSGASSVTGMIAVLTGVDTTTPEDGVTPVQNSGGSGFTVPTIDPATNGALVLVGVGLHDNLPLVTGFTSSNGTWTRNGIMDNGGGSDTQIAIGSATIASGATGAITPTAGADPGGGFAVAVRPGPVNVGGTLPVVAARTATGQNPNDQFLGRIILVGDIQTDSNTTKLNQADSSADMAAAETGVDLIVSSGDLTEDGRTDGTAYTNYFTPNWGRTGLKAKFRVSIGNHEWDSGNSNAANVTSYFNDQAQTGADPQHYFSYDLGGWHFIHLNRAYGTLGVGGTQYNWLSSDLTSNSTKPTIVIWHEPFVCPHDENGSSTVYAYPGVSGTYAVWDLLYHQTNRQVEIVYCGHTHILGRSKRLEPLSEPPSLGSPPTHVQADATYGIRQFLASIGGCGGYVATDPDSLWDMVGNGAGGSYATENLNCGYYLIDLYQRHYEWTLRLDDAYGNYTTSTLTDTGSQATRVWVTLAVEVGGARASTAALSGAATVAVVVGGARAGTAALSTTAVVTRPVAGARPTTVTLTGDITIVTGQQVNVDGARATTAARTGTAAVTRPATGTRPTTATLTGTVVPTHTVAGARPTTATLAAAAVPTHTVAGARPTTAALSADAAVVGVVDVAGSAPVTATVAAAAAAVVTVAAARLTTAALTGGIDVVTPGQVTIDGARPTTATLAAAGQHVALAGGARPTAVTPSGAAQADRPVGGARAVTATLAATAAVEEAEVQVDGTRPTTVTVAAAAAVTHPAQGTLPVVASREATVGITGQVDLDGSLPVAAVAVCAASVHGAAHRATVGVRYGPPTTGVRVR